MLVLGLETSCDETSVAVVRDGREVLSNVILSQTDHARFGGVVPEVASRVHLKTVVPVYKAALAEAGVELDRIELIAATMGPGLVGPLLVGLSFAKGLAFAKKLPFVPVNHIEGHIAANHLEHPDLDRRHLSLIVSGGHTLLVDVNPFGRFTVLGQSKDDAAGEAFDKVGKLMGLGYPGGPALDRLAQKGDAKSIKFPRPLLKENSFQFSYSGLKTAVAIYIKSVDDSKLQQQAADIAASFQEAAVEVLVVKTLRAAQELGIGHIALCGGVAANSRLRSMFEERIGSDCRLFYPSVPMCTDNAAMIAAAGFYRFEIDGPGELIADAIPYLKLTSA